VNANTSKKIPSDTFRADMMKEIKARKR